MRTRAAWAAAIAVVLAAALPGAARAHPLGNLSVNHLTVVRISADRVDVRYVLDQAEVPTFQERGRSRAEVLGRKRAEVLRRLRLSVDGRDVALRPAGAGRLTMPPGAGGLPLTRVELVLRAPVRAPRSVRVADGTFPGRIGWRAIVVRPGRGTAVRSSAPASDPTRGLRRYPKDALSRTADVREATFSVAPGAGAVLAPRASRPAAGATTDRPGGQDGLAGLLDADRVLVLLLLAAFGWGAVHALSPGHGKAMVAAYLVGTRGTPRDAVALGAVVTATHTAGVFALGFVTLALSHYVLPEDLYPWLNLASGLLVLGVGAALVHSRRRAASANARHGHDHAHRFALGHGHDHAHGHGHGHDHGHGHSHGPAPIGRRSLLAMGASAGLIPCPSALVVLLAAVSQQRVALGLLLIVAFSAGLAATLTALGLLVVRASRTVTRLPVPGGVVALLPTASALLISGVGAVLTLQALQRL